MFDGTRCDGFNGAGNQLVQGELLRYTTGLNMFARASAGTGPAIGVMLSGSAGVGGPVVCAVAGEVPVLLVPGLTPAAGDQLYVSATPGRATTQVLGARIGQVKDASDYATTGKVVAVVAGSTSGSGGATGVAGAAGPTGASGATGVSGATGGVGATGPTGGLQGVAGVAGEPGGAGTEGATGATGPAGAAGAAGATGVAGTNGATVFDLDLSHGFGLSNDGIPPVNPLNIWLYPVTSWTIDANLPSGDIEEWEVTGGPFDLCALDIFAYVREINDTAIANQYFFFVTKNGVNTSTSIQMNLGGGPLRFISSAAVTFAPGDRVGLRMYSALDTVGPSNFPGGRLKITAHIRLSRLP